MTEHRNKLKLLLISIALFTILACGIGGGTTEIEATSPPVDLPTEPPASSEPIEQPASTATDAPVLVTVTEQLASTPSVAVNGNEIVPVTFPQLRFGNAGDFDSAKAFENKTAIGGDRFTFDKFERPFNAEVMDKYFPHLDIVDTFVYQDDTWIFARIVLHGPDENNQFPGKYAAELDMDLDGKGDWLVIASGPSSTDWTTTGVQVYHDADNSVGDRTPTVADEKAAKGNGFETLVFDQGSGDDVEAAWVRLAPNQPNTVELAVKRSLFKLSDPSLRYLIGMWAGNDLIDPALFDLNDTFTHAQAGAADSGLTSFYPIKAIAEIDNSCRMAVGFKPSGREPGLCPQPVAPNEPGAPPVVGGCQASQAEINSCNQDPSYTWDTAGCYCRYIGPR